MARKQIAAEDLEKLQEWIDENRVNDHATVWGFLKDDLSVWMQERDLDESLYNELIQALDVSIDEGTIWTLENFDAGVNIEFDFGGGDKVKSLILRSTVGLYLKVTVDDLHRLQKLFMKEAV